MVTFSVEAQAPMVEPELTEVGELHSLTDWQVSEASEEAELDEFCSRAGTTRGDRQNPDRTPPKSNRKLKNKKTGVGKSTHRDRRIHRRGKDERSRALGLFFPKAAPTEAVKPLKRSVRPSKVQTTRL